MARGRPRRRLLPFLLASLALHALVVAALVARHAITLPVSPPPEPEQPAVVEVMVGGGGDQGRPAPPPAPVPPTPAPPQPAPPQSAPPQSAPPQSAPPKPAPPAPTSPAPAPTAPEPPAPPPTPPAVRLNAGHRGPAAQLEQRNGQVRAAKADSRNLPPVYPAEAALRREHGTTLARLHIDALGDVVAVEIVKSSGSPRLDGAVREAVRTWHFTPAERAGQPVPDSVEINFAFELK
ncbi:MAG: energy transducer TonB [Rhodospirillales bacterium]|nr:energy transducer TonB [Rhodospirillales bacterium]